VTTGFGLVVLDTVSGTSAHDDATTVTDTNGVAPTIGGTVPDQQTVAGRSVNPFSDVTVGDRNAAATDTLSITLSNRANGVLTGAGLTGGTDGVYTLSAATAATITIALDALSFAAVAGAPGSARPPPLR
jgi:hypothetical protein